MTETKAGNVNHAILHTHTAYAGWARFLVATVRLPDGREIKREIEDHGQAVCVLPYHPVRRTAILVRQWRAPVLFASNHQETLEAIAGVVEHEDAAACVRREAREEARLELDTLEHVFTGWTMPGMSTERMHFYFAAYAGEARPDVGGGVASEYEETLAVEIELAALVAMADRGELTDVKTLLLLQTLRLRRPPLFRL